MTTPRAIQRAARAVQGMLLSALLVTLPLLAGVSNVTQHTYHATITSAIGAAAAGDVLNVSTGVYVESLYIAKHLTVRGGYALDCATYLDARTDLRPGSGIGINIDSAAQCVFSNLDVATANNSALYVHSAAVVTCSNCRIHHNTASVGAGLDIRSAAQVTLLGTEVHHNAASGSGGGVALMTGGRLMLDDFSSAIYANSAPEGGGAYLLPTTSLILRNQGKIYNNIATTRGGGVYLSGATLTVTDYGAIGWWGPNANVVTNGDGGGVYADAGSSVIVSNNAFIAANTASGHGGGVYLTNAALLVTLGGTLGSSTLALFTNYAKGNGGSVYATAGSTVTVMQAGAILTGWAANGGGIYAEKSLVRLSSGAMLGSANSNYANVARNFGGGAFMLNSTLELRDASVLNNRTLFDDGGGCELRGATTLVASNALFAGNAASGYSGAIDAWTSPNTTTLVMLDAVVVSNNSARFDAGGIGFWSTTNLVLRDSKVIANTCGGSGAGLYLVTSRSTDIRNGQVLYNKAGDHGGGIAVFLGALAMTDCMLSYNQASQDGDGLGDGGAVYVGPGATAALQSRTGSLNCHYNRAVNGGAVYVSAGATLTLAQAGMNAVELYGNTATANGGALCLVTNAAATATGYVALGANTALNGGGVFITNGGSFSMLPSNTTTALLFANKAQQNGGALCLVDAGSRAQLNGVTVGGHYGGNQALCEGFGSGGGGAALFEGARLDAVNCAFENNVSSNNGGAICVQNGQANITADFSGPGTLIKPPCTFINNTATFNGGALHCATSSARIAVEDAFIVSNAAGIGPAAYAMDGLVSMVNCVLARNPGGSAVAGFGAARPRFTHCTLADNPGGALQSMAGVVMTNSVVWGNGGTAIAAGLMPRIDYCDVQTNMAGTGNISADPKFAAADVLDYRLTQPSPCTSGVSLAGIVFTDCIGTPRPQLGTWDMGAYEFVPEPCGAMALVMVGAICASRKMHARSL